MRIFSLLIFVILSVVLLPAQEAVTVHVEDETIGHVRAACSNMLAGNARLATTTLGETLTNIDSIVLCFGDGVIVQHQGDFDISEDPNSTTMAGVWYAAFTSEPTTTGVISETALAGLPGIVKYNDNLILARADANGNMTIINEGAFLAATDLTAPQKLWFVPITVHNINAGRPEDFFENTDSCIHINSDSRFSVTYLAQMDFTVDTTTSTSGTITVTGGLPDLDGSSYTVTLTNTITNEIITLTSSGSSVFDYSIPSGSTSYRFTVSDGQGCSASRIISFLPGTPLEVHLPDTTASQGQQICLPLTVNNFTGIGTFSFALKWNPAVLEFDTTSFINPALEIGTNSIQDNSGFTDQGVILFTWIDFNVLGVDIPEDSVLMEVCFNAIGQPGQRTDVTIDSYKSTTIDFTDLSNSIPFTTFPGSVTILPTDSLDFTYSACGSSTYDLDVQVLGGRGPYSYNLSGAGTQNGIGQLDHFTLSGLAAGSYTLEITDASGAMERKNIIIRNASINYMISSTGNTCSSDPNGMVYIDNPPSGDYQIEWTYNGQTYYNVDTLYNLAGGDVMVTITDESKCESPTRTVTIPYLGIEATATVTLQPGCDGSAGQVELNISGGNPDYTIYYSGNSYSTPSGNITVDIFGTEATYNIRDANGCGIERLVATSVAGGPTFTLNSETVIDINCENQNANRGQYRGIVSNNGTGSNHFNEARLFFADGTEVNRIHVVPMPMTGSIRAYGLGPGDYEWRIEGDCAGSVDTFAFSIEDFTATPPSVDATITPIGCAAGSGLGEITLTVFPDTRGYAYAWSNGESTSHITGLDTGVYTVTVTDTLSKCSSPPIDYTIQPGVVFSKIESTIPCDRDTMVDVGVTIRNEYQSIVWDRGETTEIIHVDSTGYYPFTITPMDAACIPIRDSIYVGSQAGGVQVTGLNQVLVDGCGNPEVIVVTYLSEPKDFYGFSWDNGPVALGVNEYRIFDDEVHNLKVYNDNCVAIDTNFSYTFANLIKIDSTIHDVDCYGNNNGEITLLASGGGSNNFRYEFNNSGREDYFASYTDLAPGTYTVRIIDQTAPAASPCPDVIRTFNIDEPEPFTVAVDTTQVSQPQCTGDSNGSFMLVTTGGNPGTKNIRYTYSGGAGSTTDLFLDSLRASDYYIRVEDSLGCMTDTTFTLEEPERINFSIPPIEEPVCNGYTTKFTIPSASGGTGSGYQFSVDGGVPVPLGTQLDILAGDHEITVFDGNLCSLTNAAPSIREPAPIVVDFNQPDTIQVSLGEGTDIAAQITTENPINDYIWTPSTADSLSTDNTLSFTAIDNVTIFLEVIDSRGCTGSNEIFVLVRKKRDVGIPNAFSPNGDGHNDLLTIIPGPSVRSIKSFQVYDRYGTLMWEESDISPAQAQITGWDGTYSGNPAMFDVYVALVKVEYIDGHVIQRITDVTLLK